MNLKSLLLLFFLSACVESVVVGTIVTGGGVVRNRKPDYGKSVDDEIKKGLEISFNVEDEAKYYKHIKVVVFNARIMLTGFVKEEKYKKLAIKKAMAMKNGGEVIDEIAINPSEQMPSGFTDSSISTQIWSKLKITKGVTSHNYDWNVVGGVVYVVGTAADKSELILAANTIAKIDGVIKVVSYINIIK
ncbi:MAG: BON domain-containing protein [Rickettsiales bacterium]|jgi:osmotically-inducible protein OsmY|nr:BON domain-containing protein [Rickettsiales bacterium]